MRLFKTIALCLTALFCAAVYAQDKRRVAVLEPEGNEAVTMMNKANVRGALTEIIVNTGAYTAVSRSHTDRILKEHGFQRGELSDSSRAKELGNCNNKRPRDRVCRGHGADYGDDTGWRPHGTLRRNSERHKCSRDRRDAEQKRDDDGRGRL
ncbi:MAG: hypothetical protein LBQ86_02930 [Holophagales bacterium]|nr:hypothetical protein [Holophagales bacterium]